MAYCSWITEQPNTEWLLIDQVLEHSPVLRLWGPASRTAPLQRRCWWHTAWAIQLSHQLQWSLQSGEPLHHSQSNSSRLLAAPGHKCRLDLQFQRLRLAATASQSLCKTQCHHHPYWWFRLQLAVTAMQTSHVSCMGHIVDASVSQTAFGCNSITDKSWSMCTAPICWGAVLLKLTWNISSGADSKHKQRQIYKQALPSRQKNCMC